jgi:hypothetical protein
MLTTRPPNHNVFLNKNLFARDLNTYTSVPESTKIVPVQPVYMQNTRCARVTLLPRQVTAGVAVKIYHKRKNTAAEG